MHEESLSSLIETYLTKAFAEDDNDDSLMEGFQAYLDEPEEICDTEGLKKLNEFESAKLISDKDENAEGVDKANCTTTNLGCPYCLFITSDYQIMAQHQISVHKNLILTQGSVPAIYCYLNQRKSSIKAQENFEKISNHNVEECQKFGNSPYADLFRSCPKSDLDENYRCFLASINNKPSVKGIII